ncbi:Isochorismatase hydrolase [Polyporus arcularius HHB13444]|uniref:Isochorismatase hydrolase n=1 Tax=Polyporus arcularius HHB13444 TaxID=1314778 RepID=A0A5C3PLC7_9APHY|nr:Isochorismatase hydrolase [Polyporus arcularius HHB13444]
MPTFPHPALLLIDCQEGFKHPTHWGLTRSNPAFERNLARLVALFRAQNLPIFHVAHHSLAPGSPLNPEYENGAGVAFIPEATPHPARDEPVFTKDVNSSFIGTTLEDAIRARGVRTLFVAGLETDRCVSTTVRMGANLRVVGAREGGGGGTIWLVQDATANFERGKWDAETVHAVNVASLEGEFAEVASTDEVVELLSAGVRSD